VTTASGWFAARPSGTEDVYKIYAESFEEPTTWPHPRRGTPGRRRRPPGASSPTPAEEVTWRDHRLPAHHARWRSG